MSVQVTAVFRRHGIDLRPVWNMDSRRSTPRVLAVLNDYDPRRTGGGAQLRCQAIVHALRKKLAVDIVPMTALRQAVRHGDACAAREPDPINFGYPSTGTPYGGGYCSRAAGVLETILNAGDYQFIMVSDVILYPYVPGLRAAFTGRLVVDLHNAESALYEDLVTHPGWRTAGHLRRADQSGIAAIRAMERMLLTEADLVTVPSTEDRRILLGRHGRRTPVAVLPNVVAMDQTMPPQRESRPGRCVFIGVLHYFPNVLAALDIVTAIGPAIRQAAPGMRIVLAGRAPSALLVAEAEAGAVDVVADPANIAPFLEESILLVPLTIGRGTRLKVLEAFAAGATVISTPKGIEGIDALPGEHYLSATTAAEFAGAVVEVITNPAADLRRRRAAWELAAARYSFAALDPVVDALLSGDQYDVLGGTAATRDGGVPL